MTHQVRLTKDRSIMSIGMLIIDDFQEEVQWLVGQNYYSPPTDFDQDYWTISTIWTFTDLELATLFKLTWAGQ